MECGINYEYGEKLTVQLIGAKKHRVVLNLLKLCLIVTYFMLTKVKADC